MSLITTCPACGTAFRISAEQLAAHRGDVRCGNCQHIFSALRHLTEVPAETPAPVESPAPDTALPSDHPAAPEAPLPQADADAFIAVPDSSMPDLPINDEPEAPPSEALPADSGAAVEAAATPETGETGEPMPEDGLQEAFPPASEPPYEPPPFEPSAEPDHLTEAPEVGPQAETEPVAEDAAAVAEPASEDQAAAAPEPAAQAKDIADAPLHFELIDYTGQAEEIELTSEEPTPLPDEAAEPQPAHSATAAIPAAGTTPVKPPFSRGRRSLSPWIGVPLVLLLGLTAAAQTTYFMRTRIAAHFPQTRPWLEAACARLQCTVELPRDADLLSIEDSDLQADPEHAAVLVLAATLYNHAAYAQAYPLLELTLTDTLDQPVLRRTLKPQEYLPKNATPEAGIPAAGEASIRLNLAVTGISPAGYRLFLKY